LYPPEVLRLFLLTVHYRSPIDFSTRSLDEAAKVLTRYYEFFAAAETARGTPATGGAGLADKIQAHPLAEKFAAAMDDDFNSALAIAHMHDELRNLNKTLTELDGVKNGERWREFDVGRAALRRAGSVLGLFAMTPDEFKERVTRQRVDELRLDVERIEALIAERNAARKARDWKTADACRDELNRMNVVLEDTARGTIWKIK
jgi:cysteinyl-tRNA synthetase